MQRKPRPKGVPALEKIVAENLKRLMEHNKHANPSVAGRETGIAWQQIDRILKGQKVRVDTLEELARAYGLEPYQMLIPGLDPENPQVLRAVSQEEEALYKIYKEAVAAAAAERKKGTQ